MFTDHYSWVPYNNCDNKRVNSLYFRSFLLESDVTSIFSKQPHKITVLALDLKAFIFFKTGSYFHLKIRKENYTVYRFMCLIVATSTSSVVWTEYHIMLIGKISYIELAPIGEVIMKYVRTPRGQSHLWESRHYLRNSQMLPESSTSTTKWTDIYL